jgi:pyruvate dehydrogenase E2 component (dihydrolipoamide acetyltransferase)
MAVDVKLDDWGEQSEATEAAVSVWFKKPGANVRQGDLLAELIVEKVNLTVEAPADGVLLEVLAEVGQTVTAGATLARLGSAAEWETLNSRPVAVSSVPVPVAAGANLVTSGEITASPAAKRLLRENNLTLAEVGTFAGVGRIGEEDVKRYLASRPGRSDSNVKIVPYAGLRRVIGERMSRSLHEMAQLTLTTEADVTDLIAGHEANRNVSYTALIAQAVAAALPQHPYLNATFDGENIRLYTDLNLGIAVSLAGGLVVPVIRGAGKLSAEQLSAEIERLAGLGRENKLAVEDNTGGTFTITNLGAYEIDTFTPIVNPPQVAVLGVGRIAERAAVVNGHLAIRKTVWLSLSFDHRVLDGTPAAAFLREVKQRLGGSNGARQ